jgi:hypothetical protein
MKEMVRLWLFDDATCSTSSFPISFPSVIKISFAVPECENQEKLNFNVKSHKFQ